MTYREKLELYSQGKLDEKERIEIEKDLEKQEALADYLFEHEAPPGMDDFFDGGSPFAKAEDPADEKSDASADAKAPADRSEDIAKQINRSIRKAFIKTGVIATIVALILTLFIVFALPHIVSAFYYNPSKSIGTNESGAKVEQLERDMSVYAELSIPELGPQITVGTDSYGYGNYSYYINSSFQVGTDAYTTCDRVLTGNIKRNSFECYNFNDLEDFQRDDFLIDDEAAGSVQQMNENDLYYTYVTLQKSTSYENFYEAFANRDAYGTNGSWLWCGVKVSDEEGADYHSKFGFFASPYQAETTYEYDAEAYPNLSWKAGSQELNTEKKAAEHFSSMLKYLNDNEKFMSLSNHLEPYVTGDEISYIGDNGLNVYGFIYVTDKDHVEKVLKAKNVKQVCVERAL